jgi:competence protein ComEC
MKKLYPIFVILIFSCFSIWLEVFNFNDELKVTFLNVGQGDSIFIQKRNYQILMDGGPGKRVVGELGREMSLWDREIDLVILSHPDHDHLNGVMEVFDDYVIKNVLWTGVVFDKSWERWKELLENEDCNVFIAKRGMKIYFDDAYLEVLSPSYSLEGFSFESLNNTSIVSKLVYGETSFLFPGDIDKKVEGYLINKGVDLEADVLKAIHHGSNDSNGSRLLEEVNPDIVVIQSGKNNYGHPGEETLRRFEKFGINILRNDALGSISLFTNGVNLFIKK